MDQTINEIIKDLKTNPFSFRGKSGRVNYFVYGIMPIFLVGFVTTILGGTPAALGVTIIISLALMFAAVQRRANDIGLSGWLFLIGLLAPSITQVMEKKHMFPALDGFIGTVGYIIGSAAMLFLLMYPGKRSQKEHKEEPFTEKNQ